MRCFVLAIFLFPLFFVIPAVALDSSGATPIMAPPPSSLDALYPPHAAAPLLQIRMLELDRALSALVVDLMEGDLAPVPDDLADFVRRYDELASLIPEWRDRYPSAPVEALREAVALGEPGAVFAAVGALGAVCSDCHAATMVPVKFRYHWMDLDRLELSDPVAGEDLDFPAFKRRLDLSFNAVAVDVRQGQVEAARAHLKDFRARFATLGESCAACHDTERAYYVGAAVAPLLDRLDHALTAPGVDAATVEPLLQAVGREACLKCHQVHSPATLVRAQWR